MKGRCSLIRAKINDACKNVQKIHLRRTKRLLSGHLWVFSNELFEDPGDYAPGSVVELFDRRENFLGVGYINPRSLIAVRLLTRKKRAIDISFLEERIEKALALRRRLFRGVDALRLVYSEGDYLPGLIVDRYGGCLVLQFLTFGMDNLRDAVIEILDRQLRPDTIIVRNDGRARSLEGLPLSREVVKGSPDAPVVIREGETLLEVDSYRGQKTGFFLDQKENRMELGRLGGAGKGLDLFCYTGAWAMHLALSGAEVMGVDDSEKAITLARRNAEMNGVGERTTFIKEDVFSFLDKELSRKDKQYDFVIADPPAFVKSASRLKEAVRAYRELNEKCLRLVRPGGMLVTSSCSYHLGREMFLDTLRAASKHAERSVRIIALRSQDRDHPVLLPMPETEYLKCAFLTVD
jgi:23S rRNA (cytosine1962-C5)-methyltransferase